MPQHDRESGGDGSRDQYNVPTEPLKRPTPGEESDTSLFARGTLPPRALRSTPYTNQAPTHDRRIYGTSGGLSGQMRLLVGVGIALVATILLVSTLFAMGAFGAKLSTRGQNSDANHDTSSTQTLTPGKSQEGDGALSLPAGIPSHFSFGLMNAPGDVGLMNDMRLHNGTAWDLRYQYLAGGVNTGHGWETWNQPSGAFATLYAQDSANNHYIPALVYYEMLQSTGTCDSCVESQRDLTNLNTPAVMAAYFANWRLLMQKLGTFGHPALVIVEPDLWGFMQQSAFVASNGAAAIPASVASSGDTDAAAYPNSAQGYAWALLHIRDRYAPNAALALHVSNWSTGNDIDSSTDPTLDADQTAKSTAAFLETAGLRSPAGVSTWDVLSNDVADHDSGQGAAWWDRTNQQFPNFVRYLTFAHTLSQQTKRWILLWQVPEGNQFFATENNTHHHTQDNRAEYILGHVADFARAGIAGTLFGPGNDGTMVDDASHDGVTNPPAIATYQCDHCNTHVSIYPDDDGGYLRLFVGAYYRHGPLQLATPSAWTSPPPPDLGGAATVTPLPTGSCEGSPTAAIGKTTATPNPVSAGGTVAVSTYITLSCNTQALVDIEIYGVGVRIQNTARDHIGFLAGQGQTVTISLTIPQGTRAGDYTVKVGVFQAGWGTLYGWNDGTTGLTVN